MVDSTRKSDSYVDLAIHLKLLNNREGVFQWGRRQYSIIQRGDSYGK